jgi:hypothetical protein
VAQQVKQAKGESWFVMLQTIREYALEKLEASGEEASTKRRCAPMPPRILHTAGAERSAQAACSLRDSPWLALQLAGGLCVLARP